MKYQAQIETLKNDAAGMENLYQQAQQAHDSHQFFAELQAAHAQDPDNILLQAWYYRLQAAAGKVRTVFWQLAIPLALLSGLLVWLLSDEDWMFVDRYPLFMLLYSPIAAASVLAYLSIAARKGRAMALGLTLILGLLTAYAAWMTPGLPDWAQGPTADLMALHIPVLAWAAVGVFTAGLRSQAEQRFAFVIKSLEVFTTAGLFVVAGGIFTMVTLGLFSALSIEMPVIFVRLIIAGGGGVIPVMAVAIIYNPLETPNQQDFQQGLSRFLANLLRLMIVPTLFVAVLYVFFIPFNFMEPFNNRDVLFIYNGMLFAVMGLLVGATPIQHQELSPRLQFWLRNAILAVAALAVLVSLYALAAILYRTWMDGLTMNRLTVTGWNILNIAVLSLLLVWQFSHPEEEWGQALKKAFNVATIAYTGWALFIVIAIPLIFR